MTGQIPSATVYERTNPLCSRFMTGQIPSAICICIWQDKSNLQKTYGSSNPFHNMYCIWQDKSNLQKVYDHMTGGQISSAIDYNITKALSRYMTGQIPSAADL